MWKYRLLLECSWLNLNKTKPVFDMCNLGWHLCNLERILVLKSCGVYLNFRDHIRGVGVMLILKKNGWAIARRILWWYIKCNLLVCSLKTVMLKIKFWRFRLEDRELTDLIFNKIRRDGRHKSRSTLVQWVTCYLPQATSFRWVMAKKT